MVVEAIKVEAQTNTMPHTAVARFSPGAVSIKTLPQGHSVQHCPLHTGLSEAGEANWEDTQISRKDS